MKKIISLCLILMLIISLCACGGNKSEDDTSKEEKLLLTDEMIEEIESRFKVNPTLGIVYEELTILTRAKLRTYAYETEKYWDYYSADIESYHQEDDYTFVAFGYVFAKDEYNKTMKKSFKHTITVVADEEEEKGYTIKTSTSFT